MSTNGNNIFASKEEGDAALESWRHGLNWNIPAERATAFLKARAKYAKQYSDGVTLPLVDPHHSPTAPAAPVESASEFAKRMCAKPSAKPTAFDVAVSNYCAANGLNEANASDYRRAVLALEKATPGFCDQPERAAITPLPVTISARELGIALPNEQVIISKEKK